ncbi:restriction endonuclease subunit S [Bacillus sp. AFS019443]|uniref:restriction endonuclease subunit S n=1 Tax=Bacillus sp. AFS019443 TaxID=2034279 RepID=UPI000BF73B07|nr:restriction endonuclease subunit S [Bacillus sp. AFS019443]PEU16125.1 restriction endonuclease subunit S [Bacillus sp. AFS019443]
MSNKTPQIRFEGFSDYWEQQHLSELMDFSSVINAPREEFGAGKKIISVMDILADQPITYDKVGNSVEVDSRPEIENKVENGDLVFVQSSEFLNEVGWSKAYLDQNYTLNSRFFIRGKKKKEFDACFVELSLNNKNRKQIERKAVRSTRFNVSKSTLNSVIILNPSTSEQEKIGGFFLQFDKTIALHQRELENLKESKRCFLQKMFPIDDECVPEFRFPGFTDAWEQCKLESIVERVTRKNKDLESKFLLTISAPYGLVDQNTFLKKQVESRDISNYYLLKKGEFAYSRSYSNENPWGAVKRLERYEMGALSTMYITFKPTSVDSNFLVSYFETNQWHKDVSMRAAEGIRSQYLLNISAKDFFNTNVKLPKCIEEQKRIGTFFEKLDDTIALHQKQLNNLKEIKEAFLQKMFV